MSDSSSGGKQKAIKALLYTGLATVVHWVCGKAGHAPTPAETAGVVTALAAMGQNIAHAAEHLSVHVIGERLGHSLFHHDAQHPTASGLNHDIERVLARAAARTITVLLNEWTALSREQRAYGDEQWDLDELREACHVFLDAPQGADIPKCIADWLEALDREENLVAHTGFESAVWAASGPALAPPNPCRFAQYFDWRYIAAFKVEFADELSHDTLAREKFALILHERTLALLHSNAAGIADIRAQLTAISTALNFPNESWLKLITEHHTELRADIHAGFDEVKAVIESLRKDLAAGGRKPADLSTEELKHELTHRVPDLTPEKLDRLIAYARFEADISRILKYAPDQLIGREEELKLLKDAWAKVKRETKKRPHILTFVALGGEGKTSLVAKWAAELAARDWPGCDAVFAWSFYSQGTRDQVAASSDLFLKEALTFFGDDADKAFAASPAGAYEKGQRLARIVGQRRSLLILDGLEPLQYAPGSPTPGQLKDQGIAALLKGLAATSHGLCVVTTRYSLPDLKAFWQTTAPEVPLLRLSRDAGVHLLKTFGVRGTTQEFETLVEDVKGHALTLTLLGGFLKRAFHGDIRQRDRVKFEKADEKMDGGHAFRTMAAYEQWLLRDGGDEGRREVAVLRLMGLFDRPADTGCLAALRSETIPGLTEPLTGLVEDDWEFCLSGLETAKLLTVNRDAAGALISLDAHPHLREYFAQQLRTQQPDAWRAAHRRLYEHLCATTPDKPQPTLEDLQPLYQAVAHGCQAGLQKDALYKVYVSRTMRGTGSDGFYSTRKLGAVGSDLGVAVCFFETPWSRISSALAETEQAWLLNQVALRLRALGRLTEALEPMRANLKMRVEAEEWQHAPSSANNLSELELTLGEVAVAVGDAEQSVTYADRSGDEFLKMGTRTAHADALHQAGRRAEAETRFREAEQMQTEHQPAYPLLYSSSGFQYCDLLLAAPERAAWRATLDCGSLLPLSGAGDSSPAAAGATRQVAPSESGDKSPQSKALRAVSQRAAQTLKWVTEGNLSLLDIALDHLTLGRAALYTAILENSDLRLLTSDLSHIDASVAGLRRSGNQDDIPRGLLTRAWLRFLTGARTGPESAQEDLDEAWEIAERGPMKLHMADIHLYRARLFFREKEYPKAWISPQADLAAAEKLINACGYHRRDEELADAKRAILGT